MCFSGDMCEFDVASAIKAARVAHVCDECCRQIDPGESYERRCLVFDGCASTHKTCSHCSIAREWLDLMFGYWEYGALEEEIGENQRDYPLDRALAALAGLVRMRWATRFGRASVERVATLKAASYEWHASQGRFPCLDMGGA